MEAENRSLYRYRP